MNAYVNDVLITVWRLVSFLIQPDPELASLETALIFNASAQWFKRVSR